MCLHPNVIDALVASGATAAMIAAAYRAAWVVEREPDITAQVVRTATVDAAPAPERKAVARREAARLRQQRCRQRKRGQQPDMFAAVNEPRNVDDLALGNRVCEILRGMGPQPDDANLLHRIAEKAIRLAGLKVEREYAITMPDGSNGRIDLVVEDCIAIELDRRLPRAKSLKKLLAFNGYRIAVTRTQDASREFECAVDAVVAIAPRDAGDMSRYEQRKGSVPPKETTSLRSVVDAADDCARDPPRSKSLISEEAHALSVDLMRLQRLEPDDPRCIGNAYTTQAWITKGWLPDIIRQVVAVVMSRIPVAPRRLRYFEAAIAEGHAEAARPLPVAKIVDLKPKDGRRAGATRKTTCLDVFEELADQYRASAG